MLHCLGLTSLVTTAGRNAWVRHLPKGVEFSATTGERYVEVLHFMQSTLGPCNTLPPCCTGKPCCILPNAGWYLYVVLGAVLAVLLRYALLALLRKPKW